MDAGALGTELVDCLAVLATPSDASTVRTSLEQLSSGGADSQVPSAALTLVVAPAIDAAHGVLLRCTIAPGAQKTALGDTAVYAVGAAGSVYTAGAVGHKADGSDAFAALRGALEQSGSAMNAAVNCLFFLAEVRLVALPLLRDAFLVAVCAARVVPTLTARCAVVLLLHPFALLHS